MKDGSATTLPYQQGNNGFAAPAQGDDDAEKPVRPACHSRRNKITYVVKYVQHEATPEQVAAAEGRLLDALAALLDSDPV